MVLAGKLVTEHGTKYPADKLFTFFKTKLHDIQVHCENVHHTKLHEGDWHDVGAVKHWTYVIDGKVQTCEESPVDIDEENMKLTYKLYGGDIEKQYKVFNLIVEVIDIKDTDHDAVRWTIEYEKLNEDIDPPNGYIEYFNKITKDLDINLTKA